jgi:hypothetical protein
MVPSWISLFEYIKLSFYGDESIHDRWMGAGHYRSQIDLARVLRSNWGVIVGVNFMVTRSSIAAIPTFLSDCEGAGIDNVTFQSYILNGRKKVDNRLKVLDTEGSIERIRHQVTSFVDCFVGGIKINDYSKKNWFVVVTPEAVLTLPSSDGTPDFVMGSIFDDSLSLPDQTRQPTAEALETIWAARSKTDAIVVFSEGVTRSV